MPAERELDPGASVEEFLGNMVREARKARGWSQKVLADAVQSNPTRISEVEGGALPERKLALALGKALGLGQSVVHLVSLAQVETVKDYAKPFLAKQDQASVIHAVSATVPGLLQTPDYARALLVGGVKEPDIESIVAQRMERQHVWQREDPPWMLLILSEAALWHSSAVQLQRLLDAQEQPNVTIQILPAPAARVIGTAYVLTLPDGSTSCYTEGFLTGSFSEDPATVMDFQKVYAGFAACSLTADDSTNLIIEALKRAT
ncbi:helix-turn-helix domain-containing protein [Streptomyces sp. S1]|uniref:helix-turn-helix domain-containing protein n=1 Tax=Streptomyces sp. S1 TaxID=718288 RepID=UPI003D7187F5